MTDQQRHDDPVRDHAVFSRHEGFLSKPGSDAARCMQDHDPTWTPRRQTQVRVVVTTVRTLMLKRATSESVVSKALIHEPLKTRDY